MSNRGLTTFVIPMAELGRALGRGGGGGCLGVGSVVLAFGGVFAGGGAKEIAGA